MILGGIWRDTGSKLEGRKEEVEMMGGGGGSKYEE